MEDVGMLAFTSEHITVHFLLPEMIRRLSLPNVKPNYSSLAFHVERMASMLNYFFRQLAGPQCESLTLKDPEKYEFCPNIWLKRIVEIYVNLAKGDWDSILPSAISKDGRSYNEQLFIAAATILHRIGEDGRVVQEFLTLWG
ncbi:hypothetical protein MKX03_006035 [Papaver bracteatum]|nr:hypothetical protein MKX03_006035 [Papaver bracteatum]